MDQGGDRDSDDGKGGSGSRSDRNKATKRPTKSSEDDVKVGAVRATSAELGESKIKRELRNINNDVPISASSASGAVPTAPTLDLGESKAKRLGRNSQTQNGSSIPGAAAVSSNTERTGQSRFQAKQEKRVSSITSPPSKNLNQLGMPGATPVTSTEGSGPSRFRVKQSKRAEASRHSARQRAPSAEIARKSGAERNAIRRNTAPQNFIRRHGHTGVAEQPTLQNNNDLNETTIINHQQPYDAPAESAEDIPHEAPHSTSLPDIESDGEEDRRWQEQGHGENSSFTVPVANLVSDPSRRELPSAEQVDCDMQQEMVLAKRRKIVCRTACLVTMGLVGILTVTLIIVLLVVKPDHNEVRVQVADTTNVTFAPTGAPTAPPIQTNVLALLPDYTTAVIDLKDPNPSPQTLAFNWTINDPGLTNHSDEKIAQRFALATLY